MSFIFIFGILVCNDLRLGWKMIKLVLSRLCSSLLLWNQAVPLSNSSFISEISSFRYISMTDYQVGIICKWYVFSFAVEQGKITAQGKLLLQDILLVMEQTAKSKGERQTFRERRVFLFEQEIIFSEEMDKKKNNLSHPGYIYKNSMKVS